LFAGCSHFVAGCSLVVRSLLVACRHFVGTQWTPRDAGLRGRGTSPPPACPAAVLHRRPRDRAALAADSWRGPLRAPVPPG
jgi:hypothetical protein